MNANNLFQIRVTGVLIEDSEILLVMQKLSSRDWSLPGGRLERGELHDEGVIREIYEKQDWRQRLRSYYMSVISLMLIHH
nr:NUDIX domain-containing protein [Halanaerobium sp. ST460_2HS_T2]